MKKEDTLRENDPDIDPVLTRILDGSATEEDYRYFREWISVENHKTYFRICKRMHHLTSSAGITAEEKQWALKQYRKYIHKNGSRKIIFRLMKYAAVVLISFLAGYRLSEWKEMPAPVPSFASTELSIPKQTHAPILIQADGSVVNLMTSDTNLLEKDGTVLHRVDSRTLKYSENKTRDNKPIYNTLQIPRGERFTLALSDGTRIWLNSESSLSYPVNFTGKTRTVLLTGQAYFEVKKDTAHPFIVQTEQLETEVLGTSFDISSYPDATENQLILVDGKVCAKAYGRQILLHPNQQLTLDSRQKQISLEEVDAKALIQWKDGILQLRDQSFEEMLHKLERWYNVNFKNLAIRPIEGRFNGKFDREDITQAIRTIAISARIRYAQKNDTIYIYSK